MKNILKVAIGALALTAATSSFAGQYPFPQNMKHPHGTTIEYADTDMIKAHYQKWKKAWYNSGQWLDLCTGRNRFYRFRSYRLRYVDCCLHGRSDHVR